MSTHAVPFVSSAAGRAAAVTLFPAPARAAWLDDVEAEPGARRRCGCSDFWRRALR